jgi:DNA-binding transcriptional ArsR family regulator
MVEYRTQLDAVFHALGDPTRRDILRRVMYRELSINEVAKNYKKHMSLAAVSKHVQVLESAKLVRKRRAGKQQLIAPHPPALKGASEYLERYKELWEERLDRLDVFIKNNK